MTPEHLHLALNHLPFLGAGFALIPLAIGFLTRNKHTVLAGLLVAMVSGWATPLVMMTGESAYERYEDGPVARYLDANAEKSLDMHEHRAEAWSPVLYASAVVATVCFGLMLWKPSWIRWLSSVSAVLCLAALFSGMWIAESGGRIRRPDFRAEGAAVPAPAGKTKNAGDDHDD